MAYDAFNRNPATAWNSQNLGIDDLTIGVSSEGMENYIEELKADILVKVKDKIQDIDPVVKAINNCWQGKSKENFLKDFSRVTNTICDDLEAEYNDLKNRLDELKSFYYEQDQKMMDGGE